MRNVGKDFLSNGTKFRVEFIKPAHNVTISNICLIINVRWRYTDYGMNTNIKVATILALGLVGCGEVKEFVIGQTTVRVWDYAQPWQDFPEVMRELQLRYKDEIPEDLWDAEINIHPAGVPIFGTNNPHAVCYYRQADDKSIHLRPLGTNTFDGCLGHEFAHRWVDLYNLDDDCKEADIHNCKGFKEKLWEMQKAICPLSWASPKHVICNDLFKTKPEFVDGKDVLVIKLDKDNN